METKPSILTEKEIRAIIKKENLHVVNVMGEEFYQTDAEGNGYSCDIPLCNKLMELAAQAGYEKYPQAIKKNGGLVVFDVASFQGAALREKEKELEVARKEGAANVSCDNCGNKLTSGVQCGACYQKHGTTSYNEGKIDGAKNAAKEILELLRATEHSDCCEDCTLDGLIQSVKKKYGVE